MHTNVFYFVSLFIVFYSLEVVHNWLARKGIDVKPIPQSLNLYIYRPSPACTPRCVGLGRGNTNTVIVRWKYSLGCFKNILILMLNIRPLTMFPTLKFVRPINIFKIHNHLWFLKQTPPFIFFVQLTIKKGKIVIAIPFIKMFNLSIEEQTLSI